MLPFKIRRERESLNHRRLKGLMPQWCEYSPKKFPIQWELDWSGVLPTLVEIPLACLFLPLRQIKRLLSI
jgi:hypothetical protein